MIKTNHNWWFPLFLAVVLGVVSFWLDYSSDIKLVVIPLDAREPKYEINGIKGEEFDEQGYIKTAFTAQRAWQFPKNDIVHVKQPNVWLYKQGQLLYSAQSQRAEYDSSIKKINMMGRVLLHKEQQQSDPEAQLQTSQLWLDIKNDTAKTNAPVVYRYGLSQGSAVGFEYNKQRGFLNLSSRVKAVIYDQKNP